MAKVRYLVENNKFIRIYLMEEVGKYAQPEAQMLIEDLRQIVKQARSHVAATANYELTMMYWHIGERINRDLLGNQRAEPDFNERYITLKSCIV